LPSIRQHEVDQQFGYNGPVVGGSRRAGRLNDPQVRWRLLEGTQFQKRKAAERGFSGGALVLARASSLTSRVLRSSRDRNPRHGPRRSRG
jgi:hypothetical protein